MRKAGGRPKDEHWKHVTKEENGMWKCNYCPQKFSANTSGTRIRAHLNKVTGQGTAPCSFDRGNEGDLINMTSSSSNPQEHVNTLSPIQVDEGVSERIDPNAIISSSNNPDNNIHYAGQDTIPCSFDRDINEGGHKNMASASSNPQQHANTVSIQVDKGVLERNDANAIISSSNNPDNYIDYGVVNEMSPCAACKILRRSCAEKCVLAPYFPSTDPAKFTIAHRVFGASNIINFLQELPESQRADAVSMVYEAVARIRDPVHGCCAVAEGVPVPKRIDCIASSSIHHQNDIDCRVDEGVPERIDANAIISSSNNPDNNIDYGVVNEMSPCAACKILRRRCVEKCVLAPYFPSTDPAKFTIAHRVFGANNIINFLQELPESQRADAVSSMVYEAGARIRDPVYGCVGVISHLQMQINGLHAQLAMAQAEIINKQLQQTNLSETQHESESPQQSLDNFISSPSHSTDNLNFYEENNVLNSFWEPLWT